MAEREGEMMKKLSDRFMYYSGILASVYPAAVQDLKRVMNLLEAEEKGLLVKLPCKVGTLVYEAYYLKSGISGVDKHRLILEDIPKFNKTVFLTKEEALRKLKELENESV